MTYARDKHHFKTVENVNLFLPPLGGADCGHSICKIDEPCLHTFLKHHR